MLLSLIGHAPQQAEAERSSRIPPVRPLRGLNPIMKRQGIQYSPDSRVSASVPIMKFEETAVHLGYRRSSTALLH